mgnify:CR=1 FL=1
MLTPTLNLRTCAYCETKFQPARSMQAVCSPTCARRKVARDKQQAKERAKVEKAMDTAKRNSLKSHSEVKAEAQKAVNAYVLVRDAGQPCISCGRMHEGAWHAGHYRSRGAAPQLALDPRNIHRQCAPCNLYLHGNQINYRLGLIAKYGVEYVEALESENEPLILTKEELREIKTIYRAKTRNLKKGH